MNSCGTFAFMLKYLSAPLVYPIAGPPIKNGVLAFEIDGTIHAVLTAEEAAAQGIENIIFCQGTLIPGLINTHCHLELSHLQGKIQEHLGLQGFVRQVIARRGSEEEQDILVAMYQADEAMYANGIVAVGDISNQTISKTVKLESKIYYHTFVETMGFNPVHAEVIMAQALRTQEDFAPLKASIVPHAPYSVSRELFAEIRAHAEKQENLISMHNQETADENLFFEQKKGAFLKLYAFLGLDISFFKASGKSSLQTVLPDLPSGKVLLVHNTMTQAADVVAAQSLNNKLFWCLCPNANLYIEGRLPEVDMLRRGELKITLGTDSLASNHQLSILAEMKTLQDHAGVGFAEMLLWATLNGAEFLGIAQQFGSFESGKKPGINIVENLEGGKITANTTIKRLL